MGFVEAMPRTDKIVLSPGVPGLVIPGTLEEEDLAGGRQLPPQSDDEDMPDGRSPKKQKRAAGRSGLDVEVLRGLLAEQAASINEKNRAAIAEALGGLRKDFEGHRAEVKTEMAAAAARVSTVEEKLVAMDENHEAGDWGYPVGPTWRDVSRG